MLAWLQGPVKRGVEQGTSAVHNPQRGLQMIGALGIGVLYSQALHHLLVLAACANPLAS